MRKGRKKVENKKRNKSKEQKTNIRMIDLNPMIEIFTLNVNGLNIRKRLLRADKKCEPSLRCLQEICFKHKDSKR